MKSQTKENIIDFIDKNEKVRPHDLAQKFQLSLVSIHKHLKNLQTQGLIEKIGYPPLVFYQRAKTPEKIQKEDQILPTDREFLSKHYLYVSPEGRFLSGVSGFWEWVVQTKQQKQFLSLIQEYKKVRAEADRHFSNKFWIVAVDKFTQTFSKVYLDEVMYQDFYSLPKFGKTTLGHYVLHAKQAQDKKMILKLGDSVKPLINRLIKEKKIDAVGWLPHSIPRKVSFLRELSKSVPTLLPTINIVKAYAERIPIAQKSLSKLEERISNAKNTIFINEQNIHYKKILLIDDAVGSGATLNEVARKLKEQYKIPFVLGFAIVGSYKGFEVIKEV